MFDLTVNVDAFIAELDRSVGSALDQINRIFRNWCLRIHADIVQLTPQWGGNLAANWYLDTGEPSAQAQELGDPEVRQFGQKGGKTPYSRGMDPAVALSMARQKTFFPSLYDRVFIHNPVEYADEVESGTWTSEDGKVHRVRSVNRVPRSANGKVAMVYHAYIKYSMTGNALLPGAAQ